MLWLSRRRCALCFGILGNHNPKRGQIAHLNKRRDDNRLENLAFLCFDHHDQFDSVTSQSKNFTLKEIVKYRDELYDYCLNGNIFSESPVPVHPKNITTGLYARVSGLDGGANISITRVRSNWDGRGVFIVLGQAYQGISKIGGPNMGFLSFYVTQQDRNVVEFADGSYTFMCGLVGDKLVVEEENEFGYHGAGAHFFGEYERILSPLRRIEWLFRSHWVSLLKNGKWPE